MPMPTNVAGGELIFATWGNSVVESLPPVGFIGMWPGATPPVNWRICDGTAISRATFATLWALFQTSDAHTRYGQGDGTSTFNLPNFRGRYPIGVNSSGAYFSIGVGEQYGNKDAVVVSHQHGMEDHYHGINFWSGYVENDHAHTLPGWSFLVYSGGGSEFEVRVGDGIRIPVDRYWGPNGATSGITANHRHLVNGNTGSASGHNTWWTGQDGTNANLPPSLSVHFIIRVS